MNRFEAIGLAAQASLGYRVLVLMVDYQQISSAMAAVEAEAKAMTLRVKVSRVNGAERIWVDEGEISFMSRRSLRPHGPKPDLILVDQARTLTVRERDSLHLLGHGLAEVIER